jgi:hypothetical protein
MNTMNPLNNAVCQNGVRISFQPKYPKCTKFFNASNKANEMNTAKKPLYSRFKTLRSENSTGADFQEEKRGKKGGVLSVHLM